FQALAGTNRAEDAAPPMSVPRRVAAVTVRKFIHAPDHLMLEWGTGPGMEPAPAGSRGVDGEQALELVEEAGLRRWRLSGQTNAARGLPGQGLGDGLPGSPVA